VLQKLKSGGAPALLEDLRSLTKRLRQKKRQAVEAELKYLQEPPAADGLRCRAAGGRTARQRRHGESTCRPYQCRFKRPGQFWSEQGDEALMCLETFWRNDRWHLLFPHITHEKLRCARFDGRD
jgi:hypothetical protein